jgi:hypothetical protein
MDLLLPQMLSNSKPDGSVTDGFGQVVLRLNNNNNNTP